MTCGELYQLAYQAQIKECNIEKAEKLFEIVIAEYPESPEAQLSENYLQNIELQIGIH